LSSITNVFFTGIRGRFLKTLSWGIALSLSAARPRLARLRKI
jgi:hypothetical protein